jgi:hypothetical protein
VEKVTNAVEYHADAASVVKRLEEEQALGGAMKVARVLWQSGCCSGGAPSTAHKYWLGGGKHH